jgi:long-chain acyl-CoA synthetase
VFERFFMLASMAYQIRYGFYQGDVLKLKEDLAVLKPTLMISVPRLFNRFYDVMKQKMGEVTGVKRTIMEWGV